MAHTDFDFVDEMFYGHDVEICSSISRIGTKSFTIYQEAWQNGKLCVKGNAVVVYYDFKKRQSIPIPQDKIKLLEEHLLEKKEKKE